MHSVQKAVSILHNARDRDGSTFEFTLHMMNALVGNYNKVLQCYLLHAKGVSQV
jgi:hypothetical protein